MDFVINAINLFDLGTFLFTDVKQTFLILYKLGLNRWWHLYWSDLIEVSCLSVFKISQIR